MGENLRQYYNAPTQMQILGLIVTAFLDPFMQNSTIILLSLYMGKSSFYTEQVQTALSFFICTYFAVTFISSLVIGISISARHHSRELKWVQILVCILNLVYFLFVFVPSVQNHYFYNEIYSQIKNGAVIRNIP